MAREPHTMPDPNAIQPPALGASAGAGGLCPEPDPGLSTCYTKIGRIGVGRRIDSYPALRSSSSAMSGPSDWLQILPLLFTCWLTEQVTAFLSLCFLIFKRNKLQNPLDRVL